MKAIIATLIILSIAAGFSKTVQEYLPAIVIAAAVVGGWLALTTEGGLSARGTWPQNDIRSENTPAEYHPVDRL